MSIKLFVTKELTYLFMMQSLNTYGIFIYVRDLNKSYIYVTGLHDIFLLRSFYYSHVFTFSADLLIIWFFILFFAYYLLIIWLTRAAVA